VLADALVGGPWTERDLVERGTVVVGRRGRWLRPLVRRVLAAFPGPPRPPSERVLGQIAADVPFQRACTTHAIGLSGRPAPPPVMAPTPGAPAAWPVPPLATPGALAEWLGLKPGALDWYADAQARERKTPPGPRRHYDRRWVARRAGAARLIEAPRPRLKAIQRHVLQGLLAHIPPHDAAHGFRPGRSIRTYAAPHVGHAVVLKLDLKDFFPSVTAARVAAILATAGYPEPVARRLAGLCTTSTPADAWDAPGAPATPDARLRRLLREPHLPQGAPTSPALANLAAWRLDARLAALATAAGAVYTRYADDLAFSGDAEFARRVERFYVHACATAIEEGFEVNTRKTRLMRRGVRQRIAGVVVNAHPNVARDAFDALKATLHNCARHGPASQNRDAIPDFRAHLAGRVAHVEAINPARGSKLRALFDRIAW
jgi:retron-type reverse transcriptase